MSRHLKLVLLENPAQARLAGTGLAPAEQRCQNQEGPRLNTALPDLAAGLHRGLRPAGTTQGCGMTQPGHMPASAHGDAGPGSRAALKAGPATVMTRQPDVSLGPDRAPASAAPVIVVGGGQSGLAAARALHELGMPAVILEASARPAGSWPRYYDSLHLFSPAEYSSMPGMPFPGAPDRYPGRDEVADYLERYAARLDVEIRTSTRVATIRQDGRQFIVVTECGQALRASGIVAASGSFSNPYRPAFPGDQGFTGELSHVADYRNPAPYTGQRVIVVGAGDSAAQVANELAPVAAVTLASRHPMRFIPQRLGGEDIHYWLRETGFDTLPPEWLSKITGGSVVTDSVGFQQTLADDRADRRPMFTELDGNKVIWSDGQRETVDAIILATGYRPSLNYLHELGALDSEGTPVHVRGISSTHAGLVYLGLEFQGSFASNTLRGVSHDARAVIAPLVAWIRDAPAQVGLGPRDHLPAS